MSSVTVLDKFESEKSFTKADKTRNLVGEGGGGL